MLPELLRREVVRVFASREMAERSVMVEIEEDELKSFAGQRTGELRWRATGRKVKRLVVDMEATVARNVELTEFACATLRPIQRKAMRELRAENKALRALCERTT
jgi:hypothetical protein